MPRLAIVPLLLALFVVAACDLDDEANAQPATTATAPTSGATPRSEVDDAIRVDRVVDGDTLDVRIAGEVYRVRLLLVDTPEVHGRTDCYGAEASAFVSDLLPEGTVVELERDVSETDRFGRLLRYVYLEDGRMVNELLLEQGYAQVVTFPPDLRYIERFLALQAEARDAGRGLWSACIDEGDHIEVTITSVTSHVEVGGTATLTAAVEGAAQCSLSYTTPAGSASSAQGLGEAAVVDGEVTWSWRIAPGTTPGTGIVRVECDEVRRTAPIEIR